METLFLSLRRCANHQLTDLDELSVASLSCSRKLFSSTVKFEPQFVVVVVVVIVRPFSNFRYFR